MRASDAAHKAAWTLTKIRPTTAPGATALFTYTCTDSSLKHRDEWALPALANAVIGAKQIAHADAELFDLGEKILTTAADALLSSRLHDDAETIIHAWRQQNPAPKTAKALARWKRRYTAANRACGYDKADAKWSGHCFELMKLTEEIGDYAVNTADGIEIKEAIIASYKDSHTIGLDFEEKITESIRRDLKHLKRIGAVIVGKAAQSMSAEIISFRKPQSALVKRRRKMRDAGEGTIGDLIAEFGCAPTTSEIREALDRWRRARRDSETVRVMFGSGLYEVEFCGNERATRHRDPLSDSF